jgi:hypothetical protein
MPGAASGESPVQREQSQASTTASVPVAPSLRRSREGSLSPRGWLSRGRPGRPSRPSVAVSMRRPTRETNDSAGGPRKDSFHILGVCSDADRTSHRRVEGQAGSSSRTPSARDMATRIRVAERAQFRVDHGRGSQPRASGLAVSALRQWHLRRSGAGVRVVVMGDISRPLRPARGSDQHESNWSTSIVGVAHSELPPSARGESTRWRERSRWPGHLGAGHPLTEGAQGCRPRCDDSVADVR